MEIAEKDLPFRAEYAKTSRASCKACKMKIEQATIRLAVMVQSSFFDGKQANWFHQHCFFNKQRPTSEGDFGNFSNLKIEDQKKLRSKIEECGGSNVVASNKNGKGKKRTKNETIVGGPIKDYGIEYAKSGRANCAGCQLKITKDQVRIKKTVFDTEIGSKFGGQALWHHLDCFTELRKELGFFVSGDNLPGYSSLSKDDCDAVKKALPEIKADETQDSKKMKLEPKDEIDKAADEKLNKKIESQSKTLYKYRDICTKVMKKKHVLELLEYNEQEPATHDTDKLYNQAADMLAFGALKPCTVCKNGQLRFNRSGYLCNGNLTEWVKCTNLVKEPAKSSCKIPEELKNEYPILAKYKGRVEVRAFIYVPPSAATISKTIKKDEDLTGPRVKRERPPLYNLTFAIVGLKPNEEEIKKTITQLGGKINQKLNENTIAIISNQEIINKMGSQMKKAKDLGIHVLPIDYFDAVKEDSSGAITYITSKSLCDWGIDPSTRIPPEEDKSQKSKSIYTKSVPRSMKLKLKGGLAVDPDSGLEDVAHVYKSGKIIYNSVLGLTDIQKNKNSFYKLQILEADNKNKYWLFRSWGRIGTTIGGNKADKCDGVIDAIALFEELYKKQTGNEFSDRDNFIKRPGRLYPIDIDYTEDDEVKLNMENHIKSKLPKPVENLIKLIFDVDAMKKVMLEFDLDMEKMPLGKLSQKQIQDAYKVLTELANLVQNGGENYQFIDASNRFYTLIPHNFGIDNPPILDTAKQIQHHSELLDNLMEIECAYNMLKNDNNSNENPCDQHYEKLKTELIPLDKNSKEYELLHNYVQNTHGETHHSYELDIMDIFKVTRKGEARRFKPFKKLHNRQLLWHGSRLTNYAGILSHGLKIAPPEAPTTGYMFGKGIYFADMVSKSANYCSTSKQNSTGLMLLSEVALGDMYELNNAKYITKLPNDKHSTKGVGRTQPNPKESHTREDGVIIPLGKPIIDTTINSSLLYNEYIVYDVAQVNVQYLFKMNFKYKY